MSLDDLPIPAPMISDQLLAELTDVVGADNAVRDDLERIVHTYGKSARDLLRIRAGDIPRVPDVVVYPGNEADVQLLVDRAVAADAVIIP
jgi:alkyldihydroxyacetonephosphate synthase